MHNTALILFSRLAIAGQAKSRLFSYMGEEPAATLQQCFIDGAGKEFATFPADVFVFYTGNEGKTEASKATYKNAKTDLEHCFSYAKAFELQSEGGLANKMQNAFNHAFAQGYERVVLVGTDIPELRQNDVRLALQLLCEKDVVFGTTEDGGYYLVGFAKQMQEHIGDVFAIEQYGNANVMQATLENCKNFNVGFVLPKQDVDTKQDIQHFLYKMREDKRLRKNKACSFLAAQAKISIIVPMYNEQSTIEALLVQLAPLQTECEIILVDGGSTDATLSLIPESFTVLHSPKGRAKQMNLGAQQATGDILFFLHSDSVLPKNPLQAIRKVMQKHHAGCFGIAFKCWHPFLLVCRIVSNMRVFDRKVMFGDQGIFIDRNLFMKVGGFPELPIMEDYQFSLQLKDRGIRLGMATRRIYTSARRFPKNSIQMLKLMWHMNRLRKRYRDLQSPQELLQQYKDVR